VRLGDPIEQDLHLGLEGAEVLLEVAVRVEERCELEIGPLDAFLVGLLRDPEQRVVIEIVEAEVEVEDALLLFRSQIGGRLELLRIVLRREQAAVELRDRALPLRRRRLGRRGRRRVRIDELDHAELLELLQRSGDGEVGETGLAREILRTELAVDPGHEKPVHRVELEFANVDAGGEARDLLGHRRPAYPDVASSAMFPTRGPSAGASRARAPAAPGCARTAPR